MDESYIKVVDASTDAMVGSISYDIEIASDKLKYSSWISAFSTAGIALILTNFDKIITGSWLSRSVATYGTIVAGLLLFLSIIMGALTYKRINEQLASLRLMMTMLLKQRIRLLCNDNPPDTLSDVSGKVRIGDYLDQNEKKDHDRYKKSAMRLNTTFRVFIRFQQMFTVAGYAVAFICAVKNPHVS